MVTLHGEFVALIPQDDNSAYTIYDRDQKASVGEIAVKNSHLKMTGSFTDIQGQDALCSLIPDLFSQGLTDLELEAEDHFTPRVFSKSGSKWRLPKQLFQEKWLEDLTLLKATAAIFLRPNGEIMLAQRPYPKVMHGLWEFPGGKHEDGETSEQAMIRELQEEVGSTPTNMTHLMMVDRAFATMRLNMDVYIITKWKSEPEALEHSGLKWLQLCDIDISEMPCTNVVILDRFRDSLEQDNLLHQHM